MATASPAPAAASTPSSSSPIPLASGDYASAAATANQAYQQALASINNQRQQALQSFGYQGTIDPATGQLTNMHVDPNNPYGQFQQMLGQGAQDQQAVLANAAARGLGSVLGARGGGLAAQDLTNAKLAFGGQSAALGQNLMGTMGDLTNQQTEAHDALNNALWQAELASAQNAISNQDFNPANFSGITDQPVQGGQVPAPKTITTNFDGGTVSLPKGTTPMKAPKMVRGSRGVRYRPHAGNTFHRAVRTRQTSRRGRRR